MTYSIPARNLMIAHGDNQNYWKIICSDTDPCSESEIAKLVNVCWLDIKAHVAARRLCKNGCYAVYLVFKLDSRSHGLEKATASVRFLEEKALGTDFEGYTVFIDKPRDSGEQGRFPVKRSDEWMELKLGNFINNRGPCATVEMRISETKNLHWKTGIMIKGIEIRPHQSSLNMGASS